MVLLESAHALRADVILVQEPWVGADRERKVTKRHLAYTAVCPWQDWTERPRAITYARTDRRALACGPATDLIPHPDLVVCDVTLKATEGGPLRIYNVYNACDSDKRRPREAVDAILNAQAPGPRKQIWAGDFNLHHHSWCPQCSHSAPAPQADRLDDRARALGFSLINEAGTATHNRGHTIDLVWASPAMARGGRTRARIAPETHSGSDHETLRIEVDASLPRNPGWEGRFRMDTVDSEQFLASLREALPEIQGKCEALQQRDDADGAQATPTRNALDDLASSITKAVLRALQISTRRASGKGLGYAWWNDSCKTALARWRAARTAARTAGEQPEDTLDVLQARMRGAVKHAKRAFSRDVIDQSTLDKNFYRATKWAYASP